MTGSFKDIFAEMDKLRQKELKKTGMNMQKWRGCAFIKRKRKVNYQKKKKNEQINNIIHQLNDHQKKEMIHCSTSGTCQIIPLEKPILNI